jgi:hypothetical protein
MEIHLTEPPFARDYLEDGPALKIIKQLLYMLPAKTGFQVDRNQVWWVESSVWAKEKEVACGKVSNGRRCRHARPFSPREETVSRVSLVSLPG